MQTLRDKPFSNGPRVQCTEREWGETVSKNFFLRRKCTTERCRRCKEALKIVSSLPKILSMVLPWTKSTAMALRNTAGTDAGHFPRRRCSINFLLPAESRFRDRKKTLELFERLELLFETLDNRDRKRNERAYF